MGANEYNGYSVHPVDDNDWQIWKDKKLVKDNFTSAKEAWDWLEQKLFPVDVMSGFKVKSVIR